MTSMHIIGITVTLIAIVALNIYSGKAANTWIVAGSIMGMLFIFHYSLISF